MKIKVKVVSEMVFSFPNAPFEESKAEVFAKNFGQMYEHGYRIGTTRDMEVVKKVYAQQFGNALQIDDPRLTFDIALEK